MQFSRMKPTRYVRVPMDYLRYCHTKNIFLLGMKHLYLSLKEEMFTLSDSDRYTVYSGGVDNFFPITTLNRCEKEALILIYNSLRGIYTHATHLDDLVINALKKLDIDILLAVCVDEDDVYGILSVVKDFEAVNFDYGDNLFTFCRKFEYDWKRDLPDIAEYIGYKYDKYVPLTSYSQWFEAGVICNKKILASAALYDREFLAEDWLLCWLIL